MISTEAKRTLVKSPPELWSEISDVQSLARHLEGLGEIRITRAEPEMAVDWEAEGASGSVRLEPSGFGTKVSLSLTRQAIASLASDSQEQTPTAPSECQPIEPALQPSSERKLFSGTEPSDSDHAGEPEAALEAKSGEGPVAELTSELEEPLPQAAVEQFQQEQAPPRRGWLTRLLARRPKKQSPSRAAAEQELAPEPSLEDSLAAVEHEPAQTLEFDSPAMLASTSDQGQELTRHDPKPGENQDQVPETAAAQAPLPSAVTAQVHSPTTELIERDTELLRAMLDRLGAAHHRPFSRG
jgi:hypothetical protein